MVPTEDTLKTSCISKTIGNQTNVIGYKGSIYEPLYPPKCEKDIVLMMLIKEKL